MRPRLDRRMPLLWRDRSTVQIGLPPRDALVLAGLGPATTAVLDRLDGTHDLPALRAEAVARGGDEHEVSRLLELLSSAGAVADADARNGERPRRVEVHGAGLLGSAIATMLVCEGVPRVGVEDTQAVTEADVGPAGVRRHDLGRSREVAARAAMRQLVPLTDDDADAPLDDHASTDAASDPEGTAKPRPDLVVLAPPEGMGRRQALALSARAQTHLVVLTVGGVGVVGPLVRPGVSSCLRCHDLHRTDRDAQWPLLLGQLETLASRGEVSPLLGTATAVLATSEVLNYLHAGYASTMDGTFEVSEAGGPCRRRSWQRHPRCGCAWDGS